MSRLGHLLSAAVPSLAGEGPADAAMGVQDIAANAALLFLVGGLAMLALIVILVILQSMLPDNSPGGEEANGARQLRPVAGSSAGSGETPGPLPDTLAPAIDKAMDHAVALRLGEPRLLHVQGDVARVRLYSCAGCIDRRGGASSPGCFDQALALGRSFTQTFGGNVQAHEIRCRLRGDPECDFEVRH